ncbi:hypothetical protein JXQ70_08665 [bacterium]|nr:hypothetical protein [bacterium]
MARIGVPQGLMFYRYFPLWKWIIRESGHDLVLSRRPPNGYIAAGDLAGPGDVCLPVKLYLTHVNDLIDRCDLLFIPRLISFQKDTYNCPHFLAIPDVARAQAPKEIALLEPVWDAKIESQALSAFIAQLWRGLGGRASALDRVSHEAHDLVRKMQYRFPHRTEPLPFEQIEIRQARYIIGLVGRPYILYEPELAGKLFTFFRSERIFVITPEMVGQRAKQRALECLQRPIFWYNSRENAGAAFHLFKMRRLDGLIQVVTFGCGPDSLIKELLDLSAASQSGLPYLSLVLDQQSSLEAVQTRLEAFLDMLSRKRSPKTNTNDSAQHERL